MQKSKLQVKNKKIIDERFVRRAIRDWLFRNGWGFQYKEKETHEQGVDIQVRDNITPHHSRYFFIETKGESKSKSARQVSEVAFVYSLGQIVTRMKVVDARHAYNYGLGLPEQSANIAIRRIPWQFARKVCLYVFSVNKSGKVKLYSWQDLRKIQKVKNEK
jgi:hypothetical protein